MHPLIQIKKATPLRAITLLLTCFALMPLAQAVVPAPDGGYPNFTTAEGQNALMNLTTGAGNTAVGWFSLFGTSSGSFNTAVGAGALDLNNADDNTAVGVAALLLNTTGAENTANGRAALEFNDTGTNNTAVGSKTLLSNTTGNLNTASGVEALEHNTIGTDNTANGVDALFSNSTGSFNTANGVAALVNNTTGSGNTALGVSAGSNQTIGDDNVYIGSSGVGGVAGESNSCYIASIVNQPSPNGIQVFINSNNKLGTSVSSARFKENIKPMDKSSEALFALNPVAFRYKKEFDPTGTSQLGLVAEEVEKVNPDLIVRDKEGKPYSVRYDQVNAMLLNEFLKEHKTFLKEQRKVEEQGAMIARQQKQIEALTSGLQKVNAQVELNKLAPQMVRNND
jgi:Chaperone of endosialidase